MNNQYDKLRATIDLQELKSLINRHIPYPSGTQVGSNNSISILDHDYYKSNALINNIDNFIRKIKCE